MARPYTGPVLHHFITANRELIVERTRERVRARPWPVVSAEEIEYGVPLFLSQLADALRLELAGAPASMDAIKASATAHGGQLLRRGFTVSQVVHDYGDICQVITDLAVEQQAPITVEEFRTLNACLDHAIAEAVTEHSRILTEGRAAAEVERLGHAAHELRDVLNTALLAFHILKRGAVAVNGSTGTVLGTSLTLLREVVDRTLSQVRLASGAAPRRDDILVVPFLDDIAAGAALQAEYRRVRFTLQPAEPHLTVQGDAQLLGSAVMNLVNNAFKYTPAGGAVTLRARTDGEQVLIEVEDQCGGIPDGKGNLFQPFGERRGEDRSGLGLGLSIARGAAQAHGGDVSVRNIPGVGCVFTLALPVPVAV